MKVNPKNLRFGQTFTVKCINRTSGNGYLDGRVFYFLSNSGPFVYVEGRQRNSKDNIVISHALDINDFDFYRVNKQRVSICDKILKYHDANNK